MRLDLELVETWIAPNARVLDLGCGDGQLLSQLQATRQVDGLGLEIDPDNITTAVAAGLNIIEQDMDRGLANFPDQSFDTVVLAQAIQAVHNPNKVVAEMLRIGREGIVTFPNFGHWRCRLQLGIAGRMPVSELIPHSWYETPNIHFCTVNDFETFCADAGITILDRKMLTPSSMDSSLASTWPNLFASTAVYRISS